MDALQCSSFTLATEIIHLVHHINTIVQYSEAFESPYGRVTVVNAVLSRKAASFPKFLIEWKERDFRHPLLVFRACALCFLSSVNRYEDLLGDGVQKKHSDASRRRYVVTPLARRNNGCVAVCDSAEPLMAPRRLSLTDCA